MPIKQIVTITTAKKLTPQQRAEVQSEVKKKIGNEFQLKEIVDPSVIGGIKIAIGDREYDITIAGKLKELSTQAAVAQIITAVPLNSTQRQKIQKAIETKYGPMEITEIVDPTVIGGIKLRIGSREYDGTILAKIKKLRVQLKQQI